MYYLALYLIQIVLIRGERIVPWQINCKSNYCQHYKRREDSDIPGFLTIVRTKHIFYYRLPIIHSFPKWFWHIREWNEAGVHGGIKNWKLVFIVSTLLLHGEWLSSSGWSNQSFFNHGFGHILVYFLHIFVIFWAKLVLY